MICLNRWINHLVLNITFSFCFSLPVQVSNRTANHSAVQSREPIRKSGGCMWRVMRLLLLLAVLAAVLYYAYCRAVNNEENPFGVQWSYLVVGHQGYFQLHIKGNSAPLLLSVEFTHSLTTFNKLLNTITMKWPKPCSLFIKAWLIVFLFTIKLYWQLKKHSFVLINTVRHQSVCGCDAVIVVVVYATRLPAAAWKKLTNKDFALLKFVSKCNKNTNAPLKIWPSKCATSSHLSEKGLWFVTVRKMWNKARPLIEFLSATFIQHSYVSQLWCLCSCSLTCMICSYLWDILSCSTKGLCTQAVFPIIQLKQCPIKNQRRLSVCVNK